MALEYALILLVGFIAGIIVARLINSPAKTKQLEAELKQTKAELEGYRTSISDHFQRSSTLLKNMVKEYGELYNHFAKTSVEFSAGKEPAVNPFDFRIVDASKEALEDKCDESDVDANKEEKDEVPTISPAAELSSQAQEESAATEHAVEDKAADVASVDEKSVDEESKEKANK